MKHEDKQTTYSPIGTDKITSPKIKFTKSAVKWLNVIADLHEKEVGVLGTVRENGPNSYLIDEIFYPKHQEMNHATCEISPEGESQVAEWLISKGREADVEKVKFWGHSHHTMGVGPSNQDEIQAMERMERNKSYFVRAIFNKKGEMSISFYDYTNMRRFDHIKWSVSDDPEEDSIKKKVTEMMKNNVPEEPISNYSRYGYENDDFNYPGYHNNFNTKNTGKGKKGKGKLHNRKGKNISMKEAQAMFTNWEDRGSGFPDAETISNDIKQIDFSMDEGT